MILKSHIQQHYVGRGKYIQYLRVEALIDQMYLVTPLW